MSESQNEDEKSGVDQPTVGDKPTAKGDYKVGRGRPPKEYRWQKGQSGNPSGRRRKKPDNKAVLEQIMAEPVVVREDGKERKVTKLNALIRAHVAKAIKGDVRSAKFVIGEAARLGIGDEQYGGMATVPAPQRQRVQSDVVFDNLDPARLSDEETIELARLGKIIDLGGDFTALSPADFARIKQIAEKGRGKDVTPRA
jgi:Family of unknown function (DUF5681)